MIVCTFRTFPYIKELEQKFGKVFVFSKLKEDLVAFTQLIDEAKDEEILGVALSKGQTRQELIAVNKFNSGKVSKDGANSLQLSRLQGFPVAHKPTHTFCNWTTYKVQEHLVQQNSKSMLSFVHVHKDDLALLDKIKNPN